MGRVWAESLAVRVTYNQHKKSLQKSLVTFSESLKGWLSTHRGVQYSQIPEMFNTNGNYHDIFKRLIHVVSSKDQFSARLFFELNSSNFLHEAFREIPDGIDIDPQQELQCLVTNFLVYYYNQSIVFSQLNANFGIPQLKTQIGRVLAIIRDNSIVKPLASSDFDRENKSLLQFVGVLNQEGIQKNADKITALIRAAQIDFRQYEFRLNSQHINEYDDLTASLKTCRIQDFVAFCSQFKKTFFKKSKQKTSHSAMGLLQTFLNNFLRSNKVAPLAKPIIYPKTPVPITVETKPQNEKGVQKKKVRDKTAGKKGPYFKATCSIKIRRKFTKNKSRTT